MKLRVSVIQFISMRHKLQAVNSWVLWTSKVDLGAHTYYKSTFLLHVKWLHWLASCTSCIHLHLGSFIKSVYFFIPKTVVKVIYYYCHSTGSKCFIFSALLLAASPSKKIPKIHANWGIYKWWFWRHFWKRSIAMVLYWLTLCLLIDYKVFISLVNWN